MSHDDECCICRGSKRLENQCTKCKKLWCRYCRDDYLDWEFFHCGMCSNCRPERTKQLPFAKCYKCHKSADDSNDFFQCDKCNKIFCKRCEFDINSDTCGFCDD